MAELNQVECRRAIEALRSGVPNRDAVRALGGGQPHIEDRFRQVLRELPEDMAKDTHTPGMLIAGDFGSGKSHVLEYLRHIALEENFVCSRIVLSKETPLYDQAKLYRTAIETAAVPGKKGAALAEIAASLNFEHEGYADLYQWANRPETRLHAHLAASLFVYERVKDREIQDKILSFWGGDPLRVGDLRSWLAAQGEAGRYRPEKGGMKDLPRQRFKFIARLMTAAGYGGWVLLIDEAELIGRYAFRQRAKSYAVLAQLAGKIKSEVCPGLVSVFAITSDFTEAILDQKNDVKLIPERLRTSDNAADAAVATQAERGMRVISREALRLTPPTQAVIEQTHDHIEGIHGQAYGWEPPPATSYERLTTTSMRQYVRRWINEWDLRRLYPGYTVETVVADLVVEYAEDAALQTPEDSVEE